jgi:hypothetical protein
MYAVLSVLRRAAGHHIYVHEGMLVERGGAYFLPLHSPSPYLDLSTSAWSRDPVSEVPLQVLIVSGASSLSVAASLTKKENTIAEAVRAEDAMYTLLLGPEDETSCDGVVTRRCRMACVRGVYRAVSGRLVSLRAKNPRVAQYTVPRKRVVTLD